MPPRSGPGTRGQTRARRRSLAAQLSAPARRFLSTEAVGWVVFRAAVFRGQTDADLPRFLDRPVDTGVTKELQDQLEYEDLAGYAAHLDLDVVAFLRDLEDEAVDARGRGDVASAEASGARDTPTFFIGNVRRTGPHDSESLARALEASRASRGVPDGR